MGRRYLLFLTAAALLTTAAAHGSDLEIPQVVQWRLPNGLRVAFLPRDSAPVVTVQMWYRVGSKDEIEGRRGSAHMFEHMMFKGTTHVRPEEHARHLGSVGGVVNAFTTEDTTAYHNTVPSAYLDFAVRLEAERMAELLFRDDMISTEKEVVKEEIRQQENSPITQGLLRFLKAAFVVHPYAWTAGGTIEDIDRTSKEDLQAFYRAYYVPNNALLVVVGDVTEAAVRESVNKWLAAFDRRPEPPRPAAAKTEPVQREPRRELAPAGQLGLVISGYHAPAASHPDRFALEILAYVLGRGDSSRLHRRLVRGDRLAVQVGTEAMLREHPGLLLTFAAFVSGAGDRVEKALIDEVEKLVTAPPTAAEIAKAKNQVRASFLGNLTSVTGLANQIGLAWIKTGDATSFRRDLAGYAAVTPEDVARVARTYLMPSNRTTVVVPTRGSR